MNEFDLAFEAYERLLEAKEAHQQILEEGQYDSGVTVGEAASEYLDSVLRILDLDSDEED